MGELEENSSSQSIEDIIADDERAKLEEDKFLQDANKKGWVKPTLIGGGALIVVGAITFGMLTFNPFGGDQNVSNGKNNTTDITPTETETVEPTEEPEINDNEDLVEEFLLDEESLTPFKTKEWQRKQYDDFTGNEEELKSEVLKFQQNTDLDLSSGTLPSEMAGFTSNMDEQEVDGNFNPLFSYWTKEQYMYEVGVMTERFLNPIFGSWDTYQFSGTEAVSQFNIAQFSDIFTEDFINDNINKPINEWMPVLADWDDNDYGLKGTLLDLAPRWFGQVTSSTSDFVYNVETDQYDVTFVADIKWTAWTKDQNKLEKTGVMTLNLMSDNDALENTNNRVLINGATLKVND